MLENGEITDSTGKTVSLRHAIIILTSSFGAEDMKKGALGFGNATEVPTETRSRAVERLKEFFSPEVINRLDRICFFQPLEKSTLAQIAELELKKFNEQLYHYHTSVSSEKKVLEWAVSQLPKNSQGARDVRRYIREQVEALMSDVILHKKIKKHYTLAVNDNTLFVK